MNENPLSGVSIPSAKELAGRIIDQFGSVKIDLSNPMHRERFRELLTKTIGWNLDRIQTALLQTHEKAIHHVFNLIKDPAYQDKRMKRQKARRAERETQKKKLVKFSKKEVQPDSTKIQ